MLETIFTFLALVNCYPQDAVIISNHDEPTFYSEGIVYIAPGDYKDHILVHELVHHCQWKEAGNLPAQTLEEWHKRERQAKIMEHFYFNY